MFGMLFSSYIIVLISCVWIVGSLKSLLPETDLQSTCYDFPAQDFSNTNSITGKFGFTPKVILSEKSQAIEFTLTTVDVSLACCNIVELSHN